MKEAFLYEAFGKPRYVDTTGHWTITDNSFLSETKPLHLFTGQLYIEALGAYHYKARAYDPRLGRFLQNDPSHFAGGDTNFYRYVKNNPANFVDSQGKIIETVWDLANVAMGAASLARNIADGNYGAAALDAGALILDGAATAVPGLPGGFSSGLKAARHVDNAVDAMKGVELTAEATKVVGKVADATQTVQVAQTVQKARTVGSKGGADIVTSNGQRVDPNTGRKTYGSGKPGLHSKQHSTRKEAKDAARRRGDREQNEGDGPHKKGGRHFHPKDKDGNDIHDGMHDDYPD